MTTKQIKQWMGIGALVLLLSAAGVAAWGLLMPAQAPESTPSPGTRLRDRGPGASEQLASALPSVDALRGLGTIDLRRPLQDPPPVVVTPPPLAAKLRGTIFDPSNVERSMALFRMQDGSEQWLRAGQYFNDPVGQVTINAIGDQRVTVTYRNQEHELIAATP